MRGPALPIMEFVVISLLNGVSYGMLLFMLSSGLTLIFGMMGVLNFAHASFYMLGAYFAYQISAWAGFWPALLMVPLLVGMVGGGVERFGLRRVHRFGHVAELLFTFGLAFMVEELVHLAWGRSAVDYPIPADLDFTLFTLFNTAFPAYRAFMMAVSVAMMVAVSTSIIAFAVTIFPPLISFLMISVVLTPMRCERSLTAMPSCTLMTFLSSAIWVMRVF